MKKVDIFTDGACHGNPGPGGWAAILRHNGTEKEISGAENDTTNNRMELMAAIMGLETLKSACEVNLYTDSQYVQQGVSAWMAQWKAKGWTKKGGLKNVDLWKRLDEAIARHKVEFHWVRGHSGHPENERADRLASAAIESLLSI